MMSESLTGLVEEIYATTLDPVRYDELVRHWQSHAEAQFIATDVRPSSVLCGRLLKRHVDQALAILDRLGRNQQTTQRADVFLAGLPVPALLVDQQQLILASNQAARALLTDAEQPCLHHLMIDDVAGSDISSWLALRRFRTTPVLFLPCFLGSEASPSCIVATRVDCGHPLAVADSGTDRQGDYFLLTAATLSLDDEIVAGLGRAYQLSSAETDVGAELVRGRSPSAIAAQRQVALSTVRTQIKGLLRKLNAATIQDLVRILGGFASCVSASGTVTGAKPDKDEAKCLRRKNSLLLRDGRRLAYEDSGTARGRPIIFIHNMLFGPALTDMAIAAASRKNWRFIAPSRPGFGESDPLPRGHGADVMDNFAHDAVQLLDHLGIEQAMLLGHMSGGVTALRLAELMPKRFQAMALVNYVPAYHDEVLSTLPARQRAFALAMRHAPNMLALLARGATAYIEAGNTDALFRAINGPIPVDMNAIRRPEVRAVVVEGLQHALQQGAAALCLDCSLLLRDWTARARALHLPAHLILGNEQRMVKVDYRHEFVQAAPQYGLTTIDDAGMYLLYTHWPKVFEVLEQLDREQQPPLAATA